MDSSLNTNWYAIQTKCRREGFAAANLAESCVEVFLPKVKHERLSQGVTRISVRALFTGYFFARFCPWRALDSVRHTRGVLRILSSGSFPLPVHDEIIHAIRTRVLDDGYFQLSIKRLAPGDAVCVQAGPFEGFIGKVERESNDGKRVTIFLEAMQQARVSIEKRWLQLNPA